MFSEHRSKLEALGFNFAPQRRAVKLRQHFEFDSIYCALEIYREKYGDLLVPQRFVIGREDKDFPEECWGLALGECE